MFDDYVKFLDMLIVEGKRIPKGGCWECVDCQERVELSGVPKVMSNIVQEIGNYILHKKRLGGCPMKKEVEGETPVPDLEGHNSSVRPGRG